MAPQLGKLERVEARTLWEHEARHFTPWLACNINLLADALALDLEVLQSEVSVGSFCADIVARETGRNRQVLIENQLEATDHMHLGQLLTYAAGLEAAVIVWISPQVRDEHRQALDWLNRQTGESIDFFAVELDVVRIGNSAPAPIFRLAASPNAWGKAMATSVQSAATSSRDVAYQEFFQAVIDELRDKHQFTNAKRGQPQNWYAFRSGVISDVTYNGAFASRSRLLRAELYIDVGDAGRNKLLYDWLLTQKAAIELETGPLVWERLDDRRASRISIVRENSRIEDAAEHGPEMRAWLVASLLRLKAAFGPRLLSFANENPG